MVIMCSHCLVDPALAKAALENGLKDLIAAESDITDYDTQVGDGDCGIGLKRGAEAIQKLLSSSSNTTDDAAIFLDHIIGVVETSMDGTSGALYAIYLNALAAGLRNQAPGSGKQQVDSKIWGKAAHHALQSMGKYTPAKPGDRTLVDALSPFVDTLQSTGDVKKAAEASDQGAKSTKGMKASLGRTVYVGGEGWQGVPDPGAHGLAIFLSGLAKKL